MQVTSRRPESCNVNKKRVWHRWFFVKFCKIFKNYFFIEHLWWLLCKEALYCVSLSRWTELLCCNRIVLMMRKYQLTIVHQNFSKSRWSFAVKCIPNSFCFYKGLNFINLWSLQQSPTNLLTFLTVFFKCSSNQI